MNDAVADESLPEQASDLAMDAAVALEQMHFGAARLLAQAALEVERRLAGAPIAVDLLPTCIIAQVLYEEGRLDDAEALLVARLPEIRADGTLAGALRAYGLLARVAASRRQYGRALVILHEADALAGQRDWSQLRAASLAQRIELCVASGRVDEAERCLSRLAALADQQDAQHGDAACEIERAHTVAQARLALTRAPLAVDVASLRQLHGETLRRRERYTSVWVALLLVEALLVSGQRDEAVERLSELLRLAPAVGMHQTLVDCTPCVAALMRAIVQRRVAPAGDISELLSYASVLLSRRQDGTVDADDVCAARRAPAAAGLSERERLIIGLMGQGLSNKQIAIQLSIAPETVKSHAKRVYSKLSVRNRTEAVTLASRLGLFPRAEEHVRLNADFFAPTAIHFAGFRLDLSNQCLWRLDASQAPTRIDLPPKTFAVLRQLVEHPQRLMSIEALLDAVWPDVHVLPEVLKGHIVTLRRVLGDDIRRPRFIETHRGRGYRFIAAVDTPTAAMASGHAARRSEYFVERVAERHALQSAWQRAQTGRSQWVFVSGEAGIGKTALVDEFIGAALDPASDFMHGSAGLEDVCILSGECIEGYGGTEPFYPLLQGLARLCRSAGGKQIVAALIDLAPTWAVLLPAHVPASARESLFAHTVGAGRERMLREICDLLEALAKQRLLLLVLEDLHWSDFSTIDMLAVLAGRLNTARIMLVATFRREDAESTQHPVIKLSDALLLRGACMVLELAPLSRVGIGTWLTQGAAPNPLDEELAHFVAERCGGNPLFMQALLDHLHECGWVRKTPDGWLQTAPTSQLRDALPRTIAQVFEARIQLLAPDVQRALEAASVAGMRFSAQTVAEAAGMPVASFEDLCDGLARHGQFVRRAGTDELPDATVQVFSFSHTLVRDVFYERQGLTRRSTSHRLIGERLECLYPAGERDGIAAALCLHFAGARQWDKALDYVRRALQTAKVRHAYRETVALLDQADGLLARLPADVRALRRLEFLETRAALYAAAHDQQAVAAYVELNEQAAQLGRTDVQLRVLPGLSYVLSWSDQARSLECLDEALRLSVAFPDPRVGASTRMICSIRRVWTRGWSADDARECAAALEVLRDTGDGLAIAKAQLDYCMMQMVSTQYRKTLNNARTSYQALYAHAVKHPGFDISRGMWMVCLGVAWAYLSLGEMGRSLEEFDRGIRLFHDNGNYFAARTLQVYRGWLLVHTMDFETVLDLDRQFRAAMDRPTSGMQARERTAMLPPQQRVWTILAGLAHAGLNQREQAAACFAEAERQMEHEPIMFDWYWRLAIEWGSVDLALANGEPVTARHRARRFLDQALATEERTWQTLAWDSMARVSLHDGDLENAGVHIDAAFAAGEGFETPLVAWRLQRTAAQLYQARGDDAQALLARQRCVEARARLTDSLGTDSRFGRRLSDDVTTVLP